MYTSFNESTNKYFQKISINNNKEYFNKIKLEYELHVKNPLIGLFYNLLDTILTIDNQMEFKPQRCISTPYTDSRFNKSKPIKEYMYVRFKFNTVRKTDIPGLFFDASNENFRYGFKIYNITTTGMEKVRYCILNNLKSKKI